MKSINMRSSFKDVDSWNQMVKTIHDLGARFKAVFVWGTQNQQDSVFLHNACSCQTGHTIHSQIELCDCFKEMPAGG